MRGRDRAIGIRGGCYDGAGLASTEGLAVDASDDLVRAADQALYRAKAGGRDRVCGSAHASRH